MSDLARFVGSLNLSRFVARLRVERDPARRSSVQRLLLEEANNLAFNLGQPGSLRSEVIEGRARIAIQIAVVETLAANRQDTESAESVLRNLVEIQDTIEQYRQVIVHATNRSRHGHPRPASLTWSRLTGLFQYDGAIRLPPRDQRLTGWERLINSTAPIFDHVTTV